MGSFKGVRRRGQSGRDPAFGDGGEKVNEPLPHNGIRCARGLPMATMSSCCSARSGKVTRYRRGHRDREISEEKNRWGAAVCLTGFTGNGPGWYMLRHDERNTGNVVAPVDPKVLERIEGR